ncbi:MAG: restriction endonuclease [Acidobacteria bacterium]|nr:restriction endonuclease [Acidobacteriota bacterium]
MTHEENVLYYGDNLQILREKIAPESVDLVYLDPPFNSNRSYNVLFGRKHGKTEVQAQMQAFDDTWTWTQESERLYSDLMNGAVPAQVADAVQAFHRMLGENDVLAYLVMMAPRLSVLREVLKPTGSLYLHCDPTASHYLKVLLDSIFDPRNFLAEITWKRTTTHSDAKRWSPVADILLHYGKTQAATWNPVYAPHAEEYLADTYRFTDPDGRRYGHDNMTSPNPRPNMMYEWKGHASPPYGWRYSKETMAKLDAEGRIWYPDSKSKRPRLKRYLDEMSGVLLGNVWTDIGPIGSRARERLGYPTQKPQALLERIIQASSNEGDLVLDPFCGCGTTVAAAQALNRRWIGVDITYLAIDLIRRRLDDSYGSGVAFRIEGIPKDEAGARALFEQNPLDFERWAVSLVYGQPNERQSADRGMDGVIRFPTGKRDVGRAIVSVKGGRSINPGMVRDLKGTVEGEGAAMGVLVTLAEPTRGMREAANRSGSYEWPVNGQAFPKVQLVAVRELLEGKHPDMPPALSPYLQAPKHQPVVREMRLDYSDGR